MSDARRVDVCVIGLGPAGARAAAAAARRGLRVLALDRRAVAGSPVQCAEFVPALIGAEVDDLAASVRQPVDAMETYVEREAAHRTDPFPGCMIDRAVFDARLVDAARAAGAECRFGAGVRAIDRDGRVTLEDGSGIAPRVLVGADGPRSVAGRAIGQTNRELVETRQVTVPLSRAHRATDIFLSAAIPGGYGWLFPKAGVANVGAGVDHGRMGLLKRIVADLHEALAARGRVGREVLSLTGGAIPVGGMLKPWGALGATRVFLAGDAAGLANPVTGAGIAAAAHSGRLAGEASAAHLSGDAAACLDYEDELQALFGSSLSRARARRRELARTGGDAASLRRAWIAYPEYWTGTDHLSRMEEGGVPAGGTGGLSPVFTGDRA